MNAQLTLIHASVSNHIGIITLNNPQKRNCLSKALIEGVCHTLAQLHKDEVRVVILHAPAGSQVFSAGHDIEELPTSGRPIDRKCRANYTTGRVFFHLQVQGLSGGD